MSSGIKMDILNKLYGEELSFNLVFDEDDYNEDIIKKKKEQKEKERKILENKSESFKEKIKFFTRLNMINDKNS